MNLRWYLYWIKDFIFNKSEVRKAYKDIEQVYFSDSKENVEKIKKILIHAKITTDFYTNQEVIELKDFPIVNKRILVDNYDKNLSNRFKGKKLCVRTTSGSTGTPFSVVQDKGKRTRVEAAVIFFGKVCGYNFGEKQLYLRTWVKKIRKSKLQVFLQNIIPEDISRLNDEKLEKIERNLIEDKKITNILAYASSLETLSNYLMKKGHKPTDFNVKSIISSAELLQEDVRKNLHQVFGCDVVSRYSNLENGIIAQEKIGETKEFTLNWADYYFEFLQLDKDEPANDGEIARIVITDLYNYAFPMIRYDTGDLAKIRLDGNKVTVTEIYGRRVDLVTDVNDNPISPHMISMNMWEVEKVKQWKFIQTSKGAYKIILNVENGFDSEKEILDKFKLLIGESAEINFEYTDEIPVLNSGKRKYIENLYIK